MITWSYVQVFQPILNATEGKRTCWAIGAVNVLVWMAWRVPRWGPVMMRSFAHNPLSGRSYTLFTSMFRYASSRFLRSHMIPAVDYGIPATRASSTFSSTAWRSQASVSVFSFQCWIGDNI